MFRSKRRMAPCAGPLKDLPILSSLVRNFWWRMCAVPLLRNIKIGSALSLFLTLSTQRSSNPEISSGQSNVWRIDPNVPLILMAANLAPHKGQETALHAAAILKQRGFHTQFWFAGVERGGNLDYTKRLRRLVGELGISDQVRFLGQRDDIPELLRAADFFVLPSTAEGLPLSILEAQASGTPVLAAPTAGIPEIVIAGETGILVDANDAAGYAHHIKSLLCKRTQYFRLSERGRELVVREHSWKRYFSKMWDIYQELVT